MDRVQTPILSIGSQIEIGEDTLTIVGIKGYRHTDINGDIKVFPIVQLSNGQEIVGRTLEHLV